MEDVYKRQILYSDEPELINTIMFEHGDIYAAFNSARQVEGNSIFYDDTIISVAKSTPSHLLLMSYNSRSNFIKDFSNLKMLLLLGGISIFIQMCIRDRPRSHSFSPPSFIIA